MPIKAVTLTIQFVSRLIDPKPVEVQSRDTSVGMRVMSIDSTYLVLSTSAQLKQVIALAKPSCHSAGELKHVVALPKPKAQLELV